MFKVIGPPIAVAINRTFHLDTLSLKNFLTVGTAGPNLVKVSTCLLIQAGS